MTPETPDDFLDRAAHCEDLAQATTDARYRETLLYVASRWRAMAKADEARERKPDQPDALLQSGG
jgi:hypothetical protein